MRTVKHKDIDLLIDNIVAVLAVKTMDDGKAALGVSTVDRLVYNAPYDTRLAAEMAREKLLEEINYARSPQDRVIGIALSDSVPAPDGRGEMVDVQIGDFS